MKIAMVSMYLPSGSKIGSGYQAHRIANRLVEQGHEVDMFSPCPQPADARYRVVHVDDGNRWRTLRFAQALRALDFRDYDVLHAHGDDYLLFGKRHPVHVRTMHGSCFAEAIHIHGTKERLRMLVLGVSEVVSTVVADRTVPVSQATKHWYPWIGPVIPNGVDLHHYRPGPERSAVPSILFVGTVGRRKRGELLVQAFVEQIRPRVPGAELWMVCEKGPSHPGIEILGRLSEAELIERYQRAWLFCLPSSYEGFGVPYAEAMACGTPVVATSNPGAAEVLAAGEFGLIVGPDAIGSTIIGLLQDPEARRRWGERGLERSRRYSLDAVVDAYLHLYTSLAG